MISGIPKLLGRGFVVGFVLPATVHYAFVLFMLIEINGRTEITWADLATAKGVGPSILIILIVSVLLLALNRMILRLFQGYPLDALFRAIKRVPWLGRLAHHLYVWLKTKPFRDHVAPVLLEMDRLDGERVHTPDAKPKLPDFRENAMRVIARFPDKEEHVLPTRFGNAMRAFEVYSRVVYGLESIGPWNRMSLLLPKSALDQLQEGRMPLDFNANMVALTFPTTAIVGYLSYSQACRDPIWLWSFLSICGDVLWLAGPLMFALVAWYSLPSLAVQWGEMYKAVFDLYRGKLAKELGLKIPLKPAEEREMWRQVSRMMMYRRFSALDALEPFRVVTEAPSEERKAEAGKPGSDEQHEHEPPDSDNRSEPEEAEPEDAADDDKEDSQLTVAKEAASKKDK